MTLPVEEIRKPSHGATYYILDFLGRRQEEGPSDCKTDYIRRNCQSFGRTVN